MGFVGLFSPVGLAGADGFAEREALAEADADGLAEADALGEGVQFGASVWWLVLWLREGAALVGRSSSGPALGLPVLCTGAFGCGSLVLWSWLAVRASATPTVAASTSATAPSTQPHGLRRGRSSGSSPSSPPSPPTPG